jgi:DeoR/GlpR family transcriptional regulator of sugar metabolism
MMRLNMYPSSRRSKILDIIIKHSPISVNELISLVDASPATIRKDLAYLESTNQIMRSHGEAHIVQSDLKPYESRTNLSHDAKQKIALAALSLIKSGNTIVLDSGTTTFEIAKLLINRFKELQVVTHSIPIANFLSTDKNIAITVPGGTIEKSSLSTVGPETEGFYSRIEANIFFLAASGIRNFEALTVFSPFQATVKKAAIASSKKVVAVIDSSKFSNVCMNVCATFSQIDCLITDKPVEEGLQKLSEFDMEIIYTGIDK